MSMTLPSPGTVSGALKHLRHIQPIVKRQGGKFRDQQNSFAKSTPKFVQPSNRIAYWNIAPGDEVMVTVGGKKSVNEETGEKEKVPYQGIVGSIDRERNLVWLRASDPKDEPKLPRSIKHIFPRLKDPEKGAEGGYTPNTAYVIRPIHYSNLRLKLPADLNLPKDVASEINVKEGVFASRLMRTKPFYNRQTGSFSWKRYAVVQSPKGGVLKIEVPWKIPESRDKTRRANHSILKTVDSETWIPWNPQDPFRILSGRSWTSPQAKERRLASKRQSKIDAKAQRKAAREARKVTYLDDRDGVYSGAVEKGVQPRPVDQPPTPAEQIWQARMDRRTWLLSPQVKERLEKGGKSFAAIDYLNITPSEGPLSKQWNALPAVSEDGVEPKRIDLTGEFESNISKRDVDNWPIELLMEGDLTNKLGLRTRMRRWNRRQEQMKIQKKVEEVEEKANIEALKRLRV